MLNFQSTAKKCVTHIHVHKNMVASDCHHRKEVHQNNNIH